MKTKLQAAAGNLRANRKALQDQRKALVERAKAQLDSVHGPIEAGAKAIEEGTGQVLHHRYVRTRANERDRLRGVLAEYPQGSDDE